MRLPSFLRFQWLETFLINVGLKDENQAGSEFRTVYLNNAQHKENIKPVTKKNSIRTSKYNLINFLPKNLFEQFRRVANLYFLINIIIIFIVPNPPTSPYTSIIPLLFVVVVTAVKQAYEDVLRHISDRKTNNSRVRVLKDGAFTEVKWADILCGDIVEVTSDQPFPCDMVLLYSHTDDGLCHITTANLDGETNLKQRSVPKNIPELDTAEKLSRFDAIIECDKPNTHLYEFNGKLIYNNQEYPITNDNVLLRGACLRISPLVYGCTIYTGHHTKVMLNSKFKANKMSVIERRLNRFIFIFLGLLAFLTFLCFGLSFIYIDIYSTHWYLMGIEPPYYKENRALYIFIVFIFYLSLLNYIVPLSMYVTVEMQRFVGSKFMCWDLELYDPETDQPAEANTSDLNEDLGQVEYLFSDKTGTLTQNVMVFKQFSIDGSVYEERNGHIYKLGSNSPVKLEKDEKVMRLLELLSVCHTVQVNESSKEKYQASSPDEFCFVEFCNRLNIIFEGDKKGANRSGGGGGSANKIREVNFQSRTRRYEIMQVLDFDSTRKRMSIILKNLDTGKYTLFCKGADSAVLRKCVSGDIQGAETAIKEFAHSGWRTLALSYRDLSQAEYANCERLLQDAYNDFMDRNRRIADAFEEIESKLILLGTTAIEDKLQEDVAETLETLRAAGIKVWVLTGDKLETAINISQSCKHFSDAMFKFILTGMKEENQISRNLDSFYQRIQSNKNQPYAFVIDGDTLSYLFKYNLEVKFCQVCLECEAVLCCRLSPAQKASIVRLIKQTKKKPITAAIGDGANDVSMIQEAHIGLGIFGKEGNNAAKSSDFCFAKFKFLKRILLVHGYLYYTRASVLVQYFFYKNIAFVICQVYYAFWNAFSAASIYNSIVLTFYNITLTAAPILIFGLFEQRTQINKITPFLYRSITRNRYLALQEFAKWNGLGLWHSIVVYFFSYALFASNASFKYEGTLSGSAQLGSLIIVMVVLIVHLKLFFEWHYQTLITIASYGLSLLGFIVCLLIPNSFIIPPVLTEITDDQELYWVYYNLFSSPQVWFLFFVCLMAAIAPDIVVHATERFLTKRANFLHQEKLRLQEMEYGGRNKQEEHQQNQQQQQYQQEQQQNQKKQREPAIFTTHRFPSSKNTRPQKQRDMSPVHVNGDVPTNNTNSAGLRNRSAARNSRGYVNDGYVANRQDLPPPPPIEAELNHHERPLGTYVSDNNNSTNNDDNQGYENRAFVNTDNITYYNTVITSTENDVYFTTLV